MPTVLFLCTGNYYRSRFAEIFFNALAAKRAGAWRATSRGLEPHAANPGPVSVHTRRRAQELGIVPEEADWRDPLPVTLADLRAADHIVAVKAAEHRSFMERLFPDWTDRVEYWEIHDLDCATPGETLACLEREVALLFDRLSSPPAIETLK